MAALGAGLIRCNEMFMIGQCSVSVGIYNIYFFISCPGGGCQVEFSNSLLYTNDVKIGEHYSSQLIAST